MLNATRAAERARQEVRRLQHAAADADTDVQAEDQAQRVADAEAAVDRAKEQHAMVDAVTRAMAAHATATRYTAAAHALGPRGPRGDMIQAGLKRLRGGLAVVSSVAGWPVIAVGDDSHVEVQGRPVELCSESEQWRAQAALQLTVAALDGSGLVVLDRADVLDPPNRKGLRDALARVCGKTGLTVVVCATGAPTFPSDSVVEIGRNDG